MPKKQPEKRTVRADAATKLRRKEKTAPQPSRCADAASVVLVGTYRPEQLDRWILQKGLYNYPVREGDAAIRAAAPEVSELWLYLGKAAKRRFAAKFEREVSVSGLARLGYPQGMGEHHGEKYLLFRVKEISRGGAETRRKGACPHAPSGRGAPALRPRILVRLEDFEHDEEQLKAKLAKLFGGEQAEKPATPEKSFSYLDGLPDDLLEEWGANLCVCEAAEQMDFYRLLDFGNGDNRAFEQTTLGSQFTCLDFFAGSGLVSAAMAKQFKTVWANDISAKKAVVFNANIRNNVLDVRPIETVNGGDLPSVDLSWGSFPCQDLSLAGDMNGLYASRSGLFWQWLRVMDEMAVRPPVVVAENVIGLVSAENGKYYVAAHEELTDRGYNVGAVMLDAVHWVPQSRKRIFVIAVKKNVDISRFVGNGPDWCHPATVANVARKVREWTWWKLPKPKERRTTIEDVIDFGAPCDDKTEQTAKLSLVPSSKLDLLMKKSERSRRVFTGYRRTRNHRQVLEVRMDGIAGCLRTPCGGSSRQIVLIAENGTIKTRLLTVREAARLMGAPDSFRVPGSYNDGYMAMGDGVAFPVARFLSEQLLAPLAQLTR